MEAGPSCWHRFYHMFVVLFCALEAYCLVLLGDYLFLNSAGELFWWYKHSSFARIVASSVTNVHLGDAVAEHQP